MTKQQELKLAKTQAKIKRNNARKKSAFEIFIAAIFIIRFFFTYGSLLWILFWSMAVDSPGEAGYMAIKQVMLGVAVLAVCVLWSEAEEWYER